MKRNKDGLVGEGKKELLDLLEVRKKKTEWRRLKKEKRRATHWMEARSKACRELEGADDGSDSDNRGTKADGGWVPKGFTTAPVRFKHYSLTVNSDELYYPNTYLLHPLMLSNQASASSSLAPKNLEHQKQPFLTEARTAETWIMCCNSDQRCWSFWLTYNKETPFCNNDPDLTQSSEQDSQELMTSLGLIQVLT